MPIKFSTAIAIAANTFLLLIAAPVTAQVVGTICNNTYALCTSAPCIPDPTAPDERAICNCVVESGINFGIATTCDERTPVEVSGTQTLVSTYSFAQADTKEVMTCNATEEAYWTDCLDVACTVDPRNSDLAICSCNLVKGGEFVTYGGNCQTASCQSAYWSAATRGAFLEGSTALMKLVGDDPNDPPFSYCSAE